MTSKTFRMSPESKSESKSRDADQDAHGGTYDVNPAFASDVGQGEYGGQPPEGQIRPRKGPLNKTTGRR